MENLFSTVLSMSKTASIVILVVLAVSRIILENAPKKFSYALWAVVLLRLLCPFAVETPFSFLPAARTVLAAEAEVPVQRPVQTVSVSPAPSAQDSVVSVPRPEQGPDIAPEESTADAVQSTGLPASTPEFTFEPAPPSAQSVWGFLVQHRHAIAAWIWLLGVAALLGHSALSLLRLRRRLVGAVPLEGEVRVFRADHIPSPFVLGVFRPKIYLPSHLADSELDYILLHERTHIRRLDYLTRALAWLAVSVHWFNPLVWLAFHLAGKDMEMSCDEAVLEQMGRDIRSDYSESLLRLSVKGLPAGPLTFGGGDPKERIANVLSYKKPALWAGTAALIVVLCVGGAMSTNQQGPHIDPDSVTSVTAFNASSYTVTEQNTIVYTPADREKDLQAPDNLQEFSREKGTELIRLINSYGKKIKCRGEFQLNGKEHHFVRLSCKDGSFYLMDYWYYNGFNFNPFTLPRGEDDYTTLLTYYDAKGNAKTTWQLEHAFEAAYQEWRSPSPPVQRGELVRSKVTVDGLDANLTFSMYTLECNVDMEGTVKDVRLQTEGSYWSPEPFPWYPYFGFEYPCGWLSLVQWEFQGNVSGLPIYAGWTDESRTSISISTMPRSINNYSAFHGYWHFTVDLSTGTVTAMETRLPYYDPNFTSSDPVIMHPSSITDEEAVEMARTAAKLIGAAEAFYRANYQPWEGAEGLTELTAAVEDTGSLAVRIGGTVDGTELYWGSTSWYPWYPDADVDGLSEPHSSGVVNFIYESEEKSFLGLSACWSDMDRKTVLLSTFGAAWPTLVGNPHAVGWWNFTVDLTSGTVTQMTKEKHFATSGVPEEERTYYPASISDEDAVRMGRIAGALLKEAEKTYLHARESQWNNKLARFVYLGLHFDYNDPYLGGDGLTMWYDGKEVRGIVDGYRWIMEDNGTGFPEDAIELFCIYDENGQLTGLRPATEEEQARYDRFREANQARRDA